MMIDLKSTSEKFKKMMTEKDQEENETDGKMKLEEMELSRFGFGFKMTDFVAFLGWTGMCLSSLMGLVAAAMTTVTIDLNNGVFLYREWFHDTPWDVRDIIAGLMQGIGGFLLVIAVGFFLLNFFLRKKNKENNLKGVKKILTIICSISAVFKILVYSIPYFLNVGIGNLSGLIHIPSIIFCCFLFHGIRKEKSGFVKAFLVYHYVVFGILMAAATIGSVVAGAIFGMFIIVPSGLLYVMVLTFLFVFNIGFYVALHSIYLEIEKSQVQMKKNIEFINASFENI